jgi:AcrR family transcriptional regulator
MANNKKAVRALINHKAEQEQLNHNNIVQALVRMKNGKTETVQLKAFGKISVKDLALEAGVSRASLYGNHKSLLEELKKINGQRAVGVTEKRKEREKKAESDKDLIRELIQSRTLLAQENYGLNEENKRLVRQVKALVSQLGGSANITSISKTGKHSERKLPTHGES